MTDTNDALPVTMAARNLVEEMRNDHDRPEVRAAWDALRKALISTPSPVAGGDLREALVKADRELSRCRNAMDASTFNGRNRTEAALAEVKRLTAALNQPAAPVEVLDDAVVALVYAARNFLYEPGWCDGISVESDALDKALDAFSSRIPPEPAASTVAQGEAAFWKAIAHQAAGKIDALLLYATSYPKDSHSVEAATFLRDLRATLGMSPDYRTKGQFKELANCLPPFPERHATHHKGSSDGQ